MKLIEKINRELCTGAPYYDRETCSVPRCRCKPEYNVFHTRVRRSDGAEKLEQRQLCRDHAEKYANSHNVAMPEEE